MEKPQPVAIEGMLEAIAQNVARTVADSMSEDMTRATQGLNVVQGQVNQVAPAIEAAVVPAVTEAIKGLQPSIEKLRKELSKRAITQKDMLGLQSDLVRALSGIQIPDYSDQIASLKQTPVDLSPILKKIDTIEFPESEERPQKWRFDVKRDRNGMIQEVVATAEE
jgi:hypothetical protein